MQLLADTKIFEAAEQLYINVRTREGRIYTDEQLIKLPVTDATNPHHDEWQYRQASYIKLNEHLQKHFGAGASLLDVGCGNGWMSHLLHKAGYKVTGQDMNVTELSQAERVFGSSDTLQWLYADIFNPAFPCDKYDVVVLAASAQYFPDMAMLTFRLKNMLNEGGQLHLIDSMFYGKDDIPAAQQRTIDYYTGIGCPEMSAGYYHHSKDTMMSLGYKNMQESFLPFKRNSHPLQWWMLSK